MARAASAGPDGEVLTLQVEQEHQEVDELDQAGTRAADRRPERDRCSSVWQRCCARTSATRRTSCCPSPAGRRSRAAAGARRRLGGGPAHRADAAAPRGSRRPPGNALAALPLTVIDRSRDVLDAVARRSPQLSARASRLSGGLADVAGRVERIGALQHGRSTPAPAADARHEAGWCRDPHAADPPAHPRGRCAGLGPRGRAAGGGAARLPRQRVDVAPRRPLLGGAG